MDRTKIYLALDILAVFAGCLFVGCKTGRVLMRKYIKQAAKL